MCELLCLAASLNIMFSRFTHVVAWISILFLLLSSWYVTRFGFLIFCLGFLHRHEWVRLTYSFYSLPCLAWFWYDGFRFIELVGKYFLFFSFLSLCKFECLIGFTYETICIVCFLCKKFQLEFVHYTKVFKFIDFLLRWLIFSSSLNLCYIYT